MHALISFPLFLFITLSLTTHAFAAHPLITDDTGTQGKGKSQIEINGEYGYDKELAEGVTVKETSVEAAAALSYGITDNMDVVLGLPYQWNKSKEDGEVGSDVDGISDMSLEMKWRLYEADGLSLALKPGLSLPTGNENKGLGNGRISYGLTFITTKEAGPWAFHLNLAITHNGYKLEGDKDADRKDIWHASLASEVEAVENLKLVANIGTEKNPDKTSKTDPAFILGGVIYSMTENFDIDFGIKAGLNKPETDSTVLAGISRRF
ncbi:MAG: transporter [Nitrospirae bacterium]|nr:transporter [Nitrospirota bacterium]